MRRSAEIARYSVFRHLGVELLQTRLRLAAARALIEASEPIAQVAPAVGFVDQSQLTRQFKAWLGVTPSAFQPARRTNVQSGVR